MKNQWSPKDFCVSSMTIGAFIIIKLMTTAGKRKLFFKITSFWHKNQEIRVRFKVMICF